MIKQTLRLLLFIFIFLGFGCEDSSAISVSPEVVGTASTDSVRITFCTSDTGYYPTPADADSLILIVSPPDNGAVDSVGEDATGLFNLTSGSYQYHRRGSNGDGDAGPYCLHVKAWYGGALRGNETVTWFATPAGTYQYALHDSTRDLVKDSLALAITAANKVNFQTGYDDSVRLALADANKVNFMVTLPDSYTIDESNAWGLGVEVNTKTGFSLAGSQTFDNTGTWTGNITGSIGELATQAKADVEAECGDALTSYDPPTRAELTTDKNSIITEVDANETKIDALDDNPWNNADSDTGAGMGAWFADWFKADYWLTAAGFSTHGPADVWNVDTSGAWNGDLSKFGEWNAQAQVGGGGGSSPWTVAGVGSVYVYLDSTANAITDVNKANFKAACAGGGSGANQVIIRCKSSTDSSAIPGASVAVWNSDQTSLMGLLATDADSGKAVFALDNGTYNLRIQKYKFQWTVPITIGVSGNKDTTVYATEFTPSPPPTVDHCTVYGCIDSVGLVGTRAKVSCDIPYYTNLKVGTKLLAYGSYRRTVYTNASGYWEVALYPNADITPTGTQYEFRIESPNFPTQVITVTVPDSTTWELTW